MIRQTWLAALPMLAIGGCLNSTTAPGFTSGADVTILFIGNSHTYTHNVPALVERLALLDGTVVETATIAYGNYSLEDHWRDGIADDIHQLRPDFVVMQQGPSSLPASRTHLVQWSKQLAEAVREADGQPALYMVWPDVTRHFAFPAVEASYADAAQSVNGRLLPAGTTWLRAWEQDPDLALYAGDGEHASYLGALAAAHTIYAGLLDVDPATIRSLDDGVSSARMSVLRAAVAASLQQWQTPHSGVMD